MSCEVSKLTSLAARSLTHHFAMTSMATMKNDVPFLETVIQRIYHEQKKNCFFISRNHHLIGFTWEILPKFKINAEIAKLFIQQYIPLLSTQGEKACLKQILEKLKKAIDFENPSIVKAFCQILSENKMDYKKTREFFPEKTLFVDTAIRLQESDVNHLEILTALLEAGWSIDETVIFGETALHLASAKGNVALVQFLLKNGADPNFQNTNKYTPIFFAHCPKIISMLLEKGACLNILNHDKNSALQQSCINFDFKKMECLLQAGDNPYRLTDEGHSLLHLFIIKIGTLNIDELDQKNIEAILELLLSYDLVNISDKFGKSALHYLCSIPFDSKETNREKIYALVSYLIGSLLAKGAKSNLMTNRGELAVDYLLRTGIEYFTTITSKYPLFFNPFDQTPSEFAELTEKLDLVFRAKRLQHATECQKKAFFEKGITFSHPFLRDWENIKATMSSQEDFDTMRKQIFISKTAIKSIENIASNFSEFINPIKQQIQQIEKEFIEIVKKFANQKTNHPPEYCCPISRQLMKDPVKDRFGHHYDRKLIEDWLDKNGTSPITGDDLSKENLMPDRELKRRIKSYKASLKKRKLNGSAAPKSKRIKTGEETPNDVSS